MAERDLFSAAPADDAPEADKAAGQNTMFGMFEDNEGTDAPPEIVLHRVDQCGASETLERERACLGFHVSGHPLDEWTETVMTYSTVGALSSAVAAKRSRRR